MRQNLSGQRQNQPTVHAFERLLSEAVEAKAVLGCFEPANEPASAACPTR